MDTLWRSWGFLQYRTGGSLGGSCPLARVSAVPVRLASGASTPPALFSVAGWRSGTRVPVPAYRRGDGGSELGWTERVLDWTAPSVPDCGVRLALCVPAGWGEAVCRQAPHSRHRLSHWGVWPRPLQSFDQERGFLLQRCVCPGALRGVGLRGCGNGSFPPRGGPLTRKGGRPAVCVKSLIRPGLPGPPGRSSCLQKHLPFSGVLAGESEGDLW